MSTFRANVFQVYLFWCVFSFSLVFDFFWSKSEGTMFLSEVR